MAHTYSKIATYTVGSGGIANVSFLNIPQTYTDLILKFSARTTENPGASALGLQINSFFTSISVKTIQADGSATPGSTIQSATSGGFGRMNSRTGQADDTTASTFGNQEIYFPNYASSNYKSFSIDGVTENNGTTAYAELNAGLWSSTSPITSLSINVYGGGGNFKQYSTFHLYGVKAEV
jgi:hypothetical protein